MKNAWQTKPTAAASCSGPHKKNHRRPHVVRTHQNHHHHRSHKSIESTTTRAVEEEEAEQDGKDAVDYGTTQYNRARFSGCVFVCVWCQVQKCTQSGRRRRCSGRRRAYEYTKSRTTRLPYKYAGPRVFGCKRHACMLLFGADAVRNCGTRERESSALRRAWCVWHIFEVVRGVLYFCCCCELPLAHRDCGLEVVSGWVLFLGRYAYDCFDYRTTTKPSLVVAVLTQRSSPSRMFVCKWYPEMDPHRVTGFSHVPYFLHLSNRQIRFDISFSWYWYYFWPIFDVKTFLYILYSIISVWVNIAG